MGVYFLRPDSPSHENISNLSAKWATIFLPEIYLPCYLEVLHKEKPVYAYMNSDRPESNRIYTGKEPLGEEETPVDLTAWLNAHPKVRDAIIWETSTGIQPYTAWTSALKAALENAFRTALSGGSISLIDPPPNLANPADDQHATTVLSDTHAWQLYLAHVANSLATEIGSWVNWSLNGYSSEHLAPILDSREMFRWKDAYRGYQIIQNEGRVIPAPPAYTRGFLVEEGLITSSRLGTIGALLDWCRKNMVHFLGGAETKNLEDQWQYRGYPPVSRVIEGTPHTGHPEWGVSHRTAGCRGTTGFLKAVLRAVNIPVRSEIVCGHALPSLLSENLYLSHGDDPYNALSKSTPPFPAVELLINEAKFTAWFGSNVPNSDQCENVGRRTRELALQYLPDYLLHLHCADVAAGRTHAESDVFNIFEENYTLAELEAQNLWHRLDVKIASFGGCDHVP